MYKPLIDWGGQADGRADGRASERSATGMAKMETISHRLMRRRRGVKRSKLFWLVAFSSTLIYVLLQHQLHAHVPLPLLFLIVVLPL